MSYVYGNKVCPRCGKNVSSYFYKFDERGRKVHLDCSVSNFENYKKMVLGHLRKHYKKYGCDFFFKSRKLKLDLNNSLIGRVCKELVGEGLVIIWNDETAQHERVYRTNFKESIGGLMVFG